MALVSFNTLNTIVIKDKQLTTRGFSYRGRRDGFKVKGTFSICFISQKIFPLRCKVIADRFVKHISAYLAFGLSIIGDLS